MSTDNGRLRKMIEGLKRLFRRNPEPELPGDPYAVRDDSKKTSAIFS